jgi:hypothetical protein
MGEHFRIDAVVLASGELAAHATKVAPILQPEETAAAPLQPGAAR